MTRKMTTGKAANTPMPVATKKDDYARAAEARLVETVAKLEEVKARVKKAVVDSQKEVVSQLEKAEKQADTHLATVKRRLGRLKDAGEDSWQDLAVGVDAAWEDLSGTIKKIVARFA